ncbi:MAG: lactonase family protein [Verrucomicrobiales bacterium]
MVVPLQAAKSLVYIGTYTEGSDSEGIYAFEFDDESGELSPSGTAGISTNPSFLALHPQKNLLFAVGETRDFNGTESGSIASFRIAPATGKLTEINRVSSYGGSPCHLVVDRAGRHALVANYHGGNVAVVNIGEDGTLGGRSAFIQHEGSSVNKARQKSPHAHSINLDHANRRAFAADLGTDELVIYDYDTEAGSLAPAAAVAVAPGSGPRHLAIRPDGEFLYLLNEIKSTINAIRYDGGSGGCKIVQTISTLPGDYSGNNGTAEVQITPDGRFLYASNRGHDSLACYRIDAGTGKLTLIEIEPTGGKAPRNFGIHPSGKFIIAANQNSDSLKVFAIDQESGELEDTGHGASCPKPVCVTFYQTK